MSDKAEKITQAVDALKRLMVLKESSAVYETADDNGTDAMYLNMVLYGFTSLDSKELTAACKKVETELGRAPADKARGVVPIDIDPVYHGDKCLSPFHLTRSYFMDGFKTLHIYEIYI
ncbi:MAG: 2-amino-4-hydroxy-6-hydroxymethyldihydropteridine diphosphokinase [Muribaculaceae bacterium]|nr:2-amino-4-hydroxy-6-hydroxymethyldihydropteridine diphosphokinase [Muribaculaceae bacterium]